MTLPALALVTSGALARCRRIAEGLEIDVERLRTNLEMSGGQIMAEAVSFALAAKMGRADAHALVRELSHAGREGKTPAQGGDARRSAREVAHRRAEIERLFIPLTYQGSAQTFIDRLVVASQMRAPRRTESRTEARTEPRPPARPFDAKLPVAPQLPPEGPAEAAPVEQASLKIS